MDRASPYPKSLSISSSAPSRRPGFCSAGPVRTRLNISSNTLFKFSTTALAFSLTRPSVARLLKSTTRITRLATSARYMDSRSPWCTSEANSGSPIIFASWSLALKSAAVREAKAVGSNCGVSPTVATSWPVRSTSSAQRAFESRRNACRCCWICLKSFSLNDQLAAPVIALLGSLLPHLAPRSQRLRDRHAVGVLQVAAHRQTAGDPGHAHARGAQHLLQVCRGHLALHRRIGRDDHFAHTGTVAYPLDERPDAQRLGPHPVQGRHPAAQHVVAPPIPPRALDGGDVLRLLHDAQQRGIPPRVAADRTRILVGEIPAGTARHHLRAHAADRLRQPLGRLRRLLEQVECEPLRGLGSDPGEPGELRHEIINGRHVALQWQLERERYTPGELPHLGLLQLGGPLLHLRHRGQHQVLEHFDVPLAHHLRSDRNGPDLAPTVGRRLHHPPAGRHRHRLLRQL